MCAAGGGGAADHDGASVMASARRVVPTNGNRTGVGTRAAITAALADNPEIRIDTLCELLGRDPAGIRRQLDIMYTLGEVKRRSAGRPSNRGKPAWLWSLA